MKVQRFVARPNVVEAVQVSGDNAQEARNWACDNKTTGPVGWRWNGWRNQLFIGNAADWHWVDVGDWLIKTPAGEVSLKGNASFRRLYRVATLGANNEPENPATMTA